MDKDKPINKDVQKKSVKKGFRYNWNDFGKQVVYYVFIMMFLHFGYMCYLANKQNTSEIFTQFTHDFKYIYIMVLGMTIWKAKSEWILDKAHKWKMSVKDLINFTKAINKPEKYPTESDGIDFGNGSYNEDESSETIEPEG